ncbi:DUF2218 domain-containing protein [Falsiphaeobacter marinintestinus]|uniref:DUF2218 domain-containing protein n=1 Tax=Falsiphaeobacter marinintestinus TaxID=1492905 RepID=UPI0011B85AE6|nr:DUF2218 domain-containing protein [Phaeobacter marinintestinus]
MSETHQSDTGVFDTPNASKYLQQLCKHFSHKATVEFTPETGSLELPVGSAQMTADGQTLTIKVTGEDLPRMRMVIDKHLERFAFREDFKHMNWATAA